MNLFPMMAAIFAVAAVLSAIYFCALPRLTRPDLYFALTVPPEFRDSPAGRAILRRYRSAVMLTSLAGCGGMLAGGLRTSPALLAAGVGLQLAGFFGAYLVARRRVSPHTAEPSAVRESALAPRAPRLPGGWALQAGPAVLLALAALYLRAHWTDIPARFPNHWGLDGRPNGWAVRSLGGVYGPLADAAIACLFLMLVAYGMARYSRAIRPGGTPGYAEDHFRRVVLGLLLATEYLLAIVFVWAAMLPLLPGPPNILAVVILPLAFAALAVVVLVRQGQGGTRRLPPAELAADGARPVGDRTQDRFWKAGMFYFNPDDPALFVEKRFGIGYTLNLAHASFWVLLGAVVLVPLVIAWLTGTAGR